MNTSLLTPDKDPMGYAVSEYYRKPASINIRVFSSQFDEDVIPVSHLFRSYPEMSPLEKRAIDLATGSILDIGAGAGCHALALQEQKKEVTAIDISPLLVETMKERGVRRTKLLNFFDPGFQEQYDTILMLMNGAGIIGKTENMPLFFNRIKQLLTPGGSLYLDSSDLRYLYEEEDGSFEIDLAAGYYGEVDFQMQYKTVKGASFDWLYIDFQTLGYYASRYGFRTELIEEGEHYDYLARITKR